MQGRWPDRWLGYERFRFGRAVGALEAASPPLIGASVAGGVPPPRLIAPPTAIAERASLARPRRRRPLITIRGSDRARALSQAAFEDLLIYEHRKDVDSFLAKN